MIDVARALREDSDWDAVLALLGKLVAENADMSRRLAQITRSFKTSEKVRRAQLVLFADAIACGEGEPEPEDAANVDGPDELDEADAKLRTASGLDDKNEDELSTRTTRPPRQPANRMPAPDHVRRVDNPLLVPANQRPCRTAAPSAHASATTSPRCSS